MLYNIKKNTIGYIVKPFFYNLGGQNFTLNEIKYEIMGCNKTKPRSSANIINETKQKRQILENSLKSDPRINFICLDFPTEIEHTSAFGA